VKRNLLVALSCVFVLACSSRPAQIGVDANYVVEVSNPMPHPMNVSLDLGAGEMSALGEVPAGGTRRFEVEDPSTNDIILIATDQSLSMEIRKQVELERGTVSRVILSDDD
jgi:hypothetical protein